MSSNITVQRICIQCNQEFIAKTTVTKFCSMICGSRFNKQKIKNSKIELSNKETQIIKNNSLDNLKEREFLTVTQASKVIGCSRQNIYKMINSNKLFATNILEKKTIIKRSEIDKLFEKEQTSPPDTLPNPPEAKEYKIENCYTITEVQAKFNISPSGLYLLIQKNNIPKIQKWRYVYVPKELIDNLFKL